MHSPHQASRYLKGRPELSTRVRSECNGSRLLTLKDGLKVVGEGRHLCLSQNRFDITLERAIDSQSAHFRNSRLE